MSRLLHAAMGVALLGALPLAAEAQQSVADFYKGKQINMLINKIGRAHV